MTLDEMRRLEAAATKPPWSVWVWKDHFVDQVDLTRADATLIAAMRNLSPALMGLWEAAQMFAGPGSPDEHECLHDGGCSLDELKAALARLDAAK